MNGLYKKCSLYLSLQMCGKSNTNKKCVREHSLSEIMDNEWDNDFRGDANSVIVQKKS